MPFDDWSQDYVVDQTILDHLNALQRICEQCQNREIFADELEPILTALRKENEAVTMLAARLQKCLSIENQTIRMHDVMWCVERIKIQFGLMTPETK
ncbi:MAG: hypothetical protein JKY45_09300 [Emcibacter sp.]|nr:hypothetical protein [Emcibacter sp.]